MVLVFPLSAPPLTVHHQRRKPVESSSLQRRNISISAIKKKKKEDDLDSFTQYSGYLFELEAVDVSEYNISTITDIYLKKKPLVLLRRFFQIASTLGNWFALTYIDTLMDRSQLMFKVRAAELRKILVQLGPAYIKIAQAVSSRSDLIPPSYLDELSLLQDQIAPFSTDAAFNTIEQELQLPIDAVFSEISPEPVAAASLGQVYQARLRNNGQVVAVKVQRPGVQAAISLDILLLRCLAGVIRKTGKFNTDLQSLVDEWASSLFREMDYKREARNGVKFRQLYGNIKDVVVPEIYMNQTTRKVLIMQWIEGQRLVEVKNLYLVEVGVYCSFNQLLEYGFYHADPHPGNLLATYDGKLAYLDFGMMGEFRQDLRDGFIEACLHLVNRDYDALAKDFVTLGLLPATSDKAAVSEALTGVFRDAIAKGVSNISFGDLLGDLGITMYKFKFRIPSYFSLVIRSLAVLEGIALNFDPNYKVLGSTYPWIARKVLTDSSPKLRSSLRALLYKDGTFRIDRLESLITESLRARTEKSLIDKQSGKNASRLVIKQLLTFALDEKSSFLREMLLEELAKGLDALGLATVDSVSYTMTASIPFLGSRPVSSMTSEDIVNLRTLQRLVFLLSQPKDQGSSNVDIQVVTRSINERVLPSGVPLALNQFDSIQELVQLFSIIPELPQDVQQQLLGVPGNLAQKLVSRAAARTLRRLFM